MLVVLLSILNNNYFSHWAAGNIFNSNLSNRLPQKPLPTLHIILQQLSVDSFKIMNNTEMRFHTQCGTNIAQAVGGPSERGRKMRK